MSEKWVRSATYTGLDGQKFTVEYDALAPCVGCGLPVVEASMGGTALCPWCDTGYNRNGDRIVQARKATVDEYETAVASLVSRIPTASPATPAATEKPE